MKFFVIVVVVALGFSTALANAGACADCHQNATCILNVTTAAPKSYDCRCNTGLMGNGTFCFRLNSPRKKTFLFAGQSNMEGNVDRRRFEKLMNVLKDPTIQTSNQMVDAFVSVLKEPPQGNSQTPERVWREEAEYLVSLNYEGLLRGIRQPSFHVDCSFYQGDSRYIEAPFVPMAEQKLLSPYSNCGIPFGPELMFGHSLRYFYKNEFSIVKVATGGTELAKHWSKRQGGAFWGELADKIRGIDATRQSWDGFVWWQGENDAFGTSGATYLKDLTNFMADVRQEIYRADLGYSHPEEIPVVIIQIGHWAQNRQTGSEIAKAQADFVANDGNAALVKTKDLSWYFHHDEATQLIVGDMVAMAMRRHGMLQRS